MSETMAAAAALAPSGIDRATPSRGLIAVAPETDRSANVGLLYDDTADAAVPCRRDTIYRRALAAADVLALLAAYAVMWLITPPSTTLLSDAPFLLALPFWVLLNKLLHLYDRDANRMHKSTLDEFPKILHSISLGQGIVYFAGPMLPGVQVHRPQTLCFWAAAIVLTTAFRTATRAAVRHRTQPERLLLVGSGQVAGLLARKIGGHSELGVELVGYVDKPNSYATPEEAGLPRLGDTSAFSNVCAEHGIERVVIAFSSMSSDELLDIIRVSKRLRMKISIVPRLFEVLGHNVEVDQIEGMTLLGLRPLARTSSTRALKRAIDVMGAGTALLALAPLMALIAAAVKLTSRGPVLFGHQRIGKGNEPFRMWKFRTMVDGADALKPTLAHLNEMTCGMFKISDDPRVTRVGRVLRRTSLDELPQLWNVVRGEMSLVGPRPLVPEEDGNVLGWHRARLDLTPGLTGPWQVMGRNRIPFHEMVKLDYLYVADWSLWNDVKLLLRTLPVVVGQRGA